MLGSLGSLGIAAVAVVVTLRLARAREQLAETRAKLREKSEDYDAVCEELTAARNAAITAGQRHRREVEQLRDALLQCGDDRAVGDMARRGLERMLGQHVRGAQAP